MWQSWKPLVGLVCLTSLCVHAEYIKGRYIVELTTPPVADAAASAPSGKVALRSTAALNHRARVRAQQATVRASLTSQPGVTVLDSVDTVANAIFVKADDAAALQNIPGVAKVYPVRKVKLLLDRAVAIHRVADAWNQIGANNAGRGIKVAIIDTGIDQNHAGFRNSTLTAPEGFPRANADTDLVYTNGKVIVARSYVDLLPARDTDSSARDRVGHGTALGMIVAGVRTVAPLATITGVAPEAWLGSYKVFGTPGINDGSTDDAIIKAMDDAVADGMDIISLSVGSDVAPRLADDPEVTAVERATRAGVIVVTAAGNNGPDLSTVGSPATATSAIAVGATTNDRTFGTAITVSGAGNALAINASGSASSGTVTGRVVDVGWIDRNGEGCEAYPSRALQGVIALIRRGTCTFDEKITNAARAGAIGVLVSAREDAPDPFTKSVTTASLPAQMISYDAGESLRQIISADGSRTVTMQFAVGPVSTVANRLAGYSSTGPGVDLSIKPDIMAGGTDFYTATQTFDRRGDMYTANGFILVDGTSFSTPFVAGVAALIKSARPGLTVDQYRSLIINTGRALTARDGSALGAQSGGAGSVDAAAALNATATLAPVSLSFGSGSADAQFSRKFTLTNLSGSEETFSVNVETNGCPSAPAVSTDTVAIAPGATAEVGVAWNPAGLPTGACEGVFRITGTSSGTALRLPWWYAVPSGIPAAVTQLDITDSGRRGATLRDAILFRISDSAGLPIGDFAPEVSVVAGGGDIVRLLRYNSDVPGLFGIDVRLGAVAGTNTVEVRAGSITKRFDITGR